MGYTVRRYCKYIAILIGVALLVAGVFYVISEVVSLGDTINDNTGQKFDRSEPPGAVSTARRSGVVSLV